VRAAGVDVLRRLKQREAFEGPAVYDEPSSIRIGMYNTTIYSA
jgi:hypothetical protein